MPDIAFVNDAFMPLSEARVSVEDRGFQFGDGVYELLRVYGRAVFHLDEHLARLAGSARALGIPLPLTNEAWSGVIAEAVKRSGYAEAKVYVQVTRGMAPRDHAFHDELSPTVVITVRAMTSPPPTLYRNGAEVITVPDLRWGRCDIKSICLLPNVLAKQQARDAGVFEAIFVRDGRVLEGATSNIAAIIGGRLVTPPEGPLLLSGVTRKLAMKLAVEAGVTVEEGSLADSDLYAVDELFLTGTTIEILPVVRVNGRQIARENPGPVTGELMSRFRKLHA